MTYKSTQVADADRLGWQRKGTAALSKVLDMARSKKLPALIWTVGLTGELVGTVPNVLLDDVDELRALLTREWSAWVDALAATPRQVAGGYDSDYLLAETSIERSVLVLLRCDLPQREPDAGDRTRRP